MKCVQPTGIENLSLLTCGSRPHNPTEILASARASAVIDNLKQKADMILFDSPPSLMVADAAILGSRVDCVFMVINRGKTRSNYAKRAVEDLKHTQVNLLGFVLNRMPARHGSYYYSQYYYNRDGDREKKQKKKKTDVSEVQEEIMAVRTAKNSSI